VGKGGSEVKRLVAGSTIPSVTPRIIAAHIAAQVLAPGYTWAQIGDQLGMTRQSAWERFR
jgi:hypothetical protein